MLAYSRMGRTSVVYARCLVLRGHVRMFLWKKAIVVFALCAVLLITQHICVNVCTLIFCRQPEYRI